MLAQHGCEEEIPLILRFHMARARTQNRTCFDRPGTSRIEGLVGPVRFQILLKNVICTYSVGLRNESS